jgi:hypothetical protein
MATPAVGRSYSKIDVRGRDLKKVMKLLPEYPSILEFGSGYSTIFFAYSAASKVVSVEENHLYAPKIVRAKNYESLISGCEDVLIGGITTRRHTDLKILEGKFFDFIYIDGPHTPLALNNEAAMNVDVIFINGLDLSSTIIGVDIRLNTVSFLENFLENTHFAVYSEKVVNSKGKEQAKVLGLHRDEYGSSFEITTLFIPRGNQLQFR